jgi:hypothetical protein
MGGAFPLHFTKSLIDTNEPFLAVDIAEQMRVADVTRMKVTSRKDIPFFWKISHSGDTSLENIISQCFDLVLAGDMISPAILNVQYNPVEVSGWHWKLIGTRFSRDHINIVPSFSSF